jgi:ketosteroid isomerase-like protein
MSHENVERAREAYAALSLALRKGDFDPYFRDFVDPEVEWVPLEGSPDGTAILRGHGPIKARLREMFDTIEEPRLEAEEFIDAGEKTVIAVRISGRGRASGVDVGATWFHVVTARGDKALRIEWYASRDQALQAAGLRE